MGRELARKLESFKDAQHLLGCTGHVFNLAAQAALKALNYQPSSLL
jgi:hypothetical protein